MASKAILFGLNYTTSPDAMLRGCINDVKNFANILESKTNIRDIEIYTDEFEDTCVTKAGIVQILNRTLHECYAKEIKHLWVHFSGHGSQVKDNGCDEKDGLDECFIPADFKTNGVLIDDDFSNIFKRFPSYTNIFCVFDCCHSGTMLDLKYTYEFNANRQVFCSQMFFNKKTDTNVIMLSGCNDDQTSADAFNVMSQRKFSGALTSCLILSLSNTQNTEHGFNLPIVDLYKNVSDLLRYKGYCQKPMLTSSFPLNKISLGDFLSTSP